MIDVQNEHVQTMNPFKQLSQWIREEQLAGVHFAQGAVLGTVGDDGIPKTRMLGVHFDQEGLPRFHTSPNTRKTVDLEKNRHASITFAFQRSFRSVSIQGVLEKIPGEQLLADWLMLEPAFRRSYLVFGHRTGMEAESDELLERWRKELPVDAENEMPASFTGYRFAHVSRIAFYAVGQGHFAEHIVFSRDKNEENWCCLRIVP